ncbi:hypothetical protein A2617_02635 [Candidatus Daviesbacteria bacterium RIFOXYD1_FULL_41_10]|uniref:Uncharacterized protein n=2 Tax=Candidatus Daviesiibacteriota TaxID=1752718 RepID=A0A1F5MZ80_9BACT|nr:MAG: hypothetical protein UU67_C0057G0009 [Candidatus Daviesbacteria bacterium GW2011_GWB1_41_5]OGE70688.1 MAG: hypothetical protein A2617_02635 [Candidatus Daviesbacteria bacterium RIFOXYD1_FULL_41_10]
MKKIALSTALLGYLLQAGTVLAQGRDVVVNITPPGSAIVADLSTVIKNALVIVFSVAAFLVLIFLIIGAFQWIMSGGDKEAVGKARSRITHALIGLVILALAFVITSVVGQIIGVDFLQLKLPFLGSR